MGQHLPTYLPTYLRGRLDNTWHNEAILPLILPFPFFSQCYKKEFLSIFRFPQN